MSPRPIIVLTGGPGGGKTTLIEELAHDPAWARCFVALPEAILAMRFLNILPREKLFQRVMVNLEMGMEDAVARALGSADARAILCHRGTLNPLAYWLDHGWSEQEFFAFTGTRRENHYRRYAAVIHLVTAADGAPEAYKRYPNAHRPEEPADAIRLNHLLEQAWSGHPKYFRIDNTGRNWAAKVQAARTVLEEFMPAL